MRLAELFKHMPCAHWYIGFLTQFFYIIFRLHMHIHTHTHEYLNILICEKFNLNWWKCATMIQIYRQMHWVSRCCGDMDLNIWKISIHIKLFPRTFGFSAFHFFLSSFCWNFQIVLMLLAINGWLNTNIHTQIDIWNIL